MVEESLNLGCVYGVRKGLDEGHKRLLLQLLRLFGRVLKHLVSRLLLGLHGSTHRRDQLEPQRLVLRYGGLLEPLLRLLHQPARGLHHGLGRRRLGRVLRGQVLPVALHHLIRCLLFRLQLPNQALSLLQQRFGRGSGGLHLLHSRPHLHQELGRQASSQLLGLGGRCVCLLELLLHVTGQVLRLGLFALPLLRGIVCLLDRDHGAEPRKVGERHAGLVDGEDAKDLLDLVRAGLNAVLRQGERNDLLFFQAGVFIYVELLKDLPVHGGGLLVRPSQRNHSSSKLIHLLLAQLDLPLQGQELRGALRFLGHLRVAHLLDSLADGPRRGLHRNDALGHRQLGRLRRLHGLLLRHILDVGGQRLCRFYGRAGPLLQLR
mmetsp:Transcript_115426/g.337557  ORF Transcript_115426/g.337557 Transcript_115426/m.337557 type:complete len:376 (-) Transcript_115426:407-1534(-)